MTEIVTLREELEQMAAGIAKLHPKPGFAHGSLYGIVAAHGQEWKWSPRPDGVEAGKLGECFSNAGAFVLFNDDGDDRYVYCEGFALSVIPVHHAWVLDTRTGEIIDLTWRSGEQDSDCGHCDDGMIVAEGEDEEEWGEERACVRCDGTGKPEIPHYERTGAEYVGIPFDTAWLRKWILAHKVWGVLDKIEPFKHGLVPGGQPGTFKVAEEEGHGDED